MATIANGRYENNGKTYDAHTGQEIGSDINPTPEALANRQGAADLARVNEPVPSPISRTIAEEPYGADAASAFLDKFTPPKTAAQLAEEKRQQSQGLIDSINKNYDTQIAQAKQSGQERIDADNAISVLSGLTGSTDARNNRNSVIAANDKEQQAINQKRLLDLQGIYTKISQDAEAEARQQLQDATKSAEDIVARRKEAQTNALANVKAMAAGGLVDFDSFKNSPQSWKIYQYALDAAGGSEDALRAVFMANRPQDQIVGQPIRVGDHFVQAYKNPISGKVSYDSLQVPGLGAEYSTFQKMGDNLVAIPTNWDGDVSKLRTIAGTPTAPDPIKLGQGELLIDPVTGKQIAYNPKTYAPKAEGGSGGAGGSGGGSSSGLKFTQTQINKGAANAGMTGDAFKRLDRNVQNFYINGGKAKSAIDTAIANVKSGKQSASQVKSLIESSNQPDAVKEHLKVRIDAVTPQQKSGSVWNKIGSFLGGL